MVGRAGPASIGIERIDIPDRNGAEAECWGELTECGSSMDSTLHLDPSLR